MLSKDVRTSKASTKRTNWSRCSTPSLSPYTARNLWRDPWGIHNDTNDIEPFIPNPYAIPRKGTILTCFSLLQIPSSRRIIYEGVWAILMIVMQTVTLVDLLVALFSTSKLNRNAFTATWKRWIEYNDKLQVITNLHWHWESLNAISKWFDRTQAHIQIVSTPSYAGGV